MQFGTGLGSCPEMGLAGISNSWCLQPLKSRAVARVYHETWHENGIFSGVMDGVGREWLNLV